MFLQIQIKSKSISHLHICNMEIHNTLSYSYKINWIWTFIWIVIWHVIFIIMINGETRKDTVPACHKLRLSMFCGAMTKAPFDKSPQYQNSVWKLWFLKMRFFLHQYSDAFEVFKEMVLLLQTFVISSHLSTLLNNKLLHTVLNDCPLLNL